MKLQFIILLIILNPLTGFSQAPAIQWQKSYGGSLNEYAYSMEQTTDGGYVVAGYASSNDGNVTGTHNSPYPDYWVVKLDNNGVLQWQKTLGGSNNDLAYSIAQTMDGGYILAGWSSSVNGDVTGHHGSTANDDYWVVKIDETGNLQWQKSLGGLDIDDARSIIQTSDGGYMVVGYSYSNNYDVTDSHGGGDMWAVKLNNTGAIEWQKSLGGSSYDMALAVQETSGGYVIAGSTTSNDGDVTGFHGGGWLFGDYWIVKINTDGDILWQKALGGSGEEVAMAIEPTSDGGYIVAGSSNSNDGDVSGNHGDNDYWIVKIDNLGEIEWQKSLGGSNEDTATDVKQTTDGGYIVSGMTKSNDGDVTGNHGGENDYWIVKLDNLGEIEWQKSLGGGGYDFSYGIRQDADGGYVIAGSSDSNDGDVTGNHGMSDFWIVKLWGDRACATWSLESSEVATSTIGAITAETELLSQGSAPPYMYILGYGDNGQRLWQAGGWQGGPLDPGRYVEFSLSPNPGALLTVTDVSFDYSDFMIGTTDPHTLFFEVRYSTDNWATSTLLGTGEYLRTAVQTFSVSFSQVVNEGETFSLRIFPYAPEHEGGIPSYATHSNVMICGENTPVLETQDPDRTPEYILYPNPTQGIVYLKSDALPEGTRIFIYDMSGRKMNEIPVREKIMPIDVSAFPDGIYNVIILKADGKRITRKLILKK